MTFKRAAGIERAFLNAPMSEAATPALVAAVSEAGGLGVIPAAELTPDEIRSFAEAVRTRTAKPFAVNLTVPASRAAELADFTVFADAISPLLADLGLPDENFETHYDLTGKKRPDFYAQFDAAIQVCPAALISSFGGFREPEADRLAEAGILNVGTATTLREAKVLRAAGCQALIVQGAEAAGPRLAFEDADDSLIGLMSLVPAAVKATGLPVLAAGGVAVPEQAEALKALGAAGVVVGTALLATEESGASDVLRYYAQHGTAADTTLTRIFTGCLARVVKNGLVEALEDYEKLTAQWPGQRELMEPLCKKAQALGRHDLLMLPIGQSAGRACWRRTADALAALSAPF